LRASYKAFVEVWRCRLSKRVEIEVAADKGTYLPGDVVNVSVRVMGKEQLDIEEGRVALVCANRYVYLYTTTDSDGDQVYRTQKATDEVAAADKPILEEKTILSGNYSGHEVAFEVPPQPRRARAARSRTSNGRSGSPSSSAGRRTSSRRHR